jgi:hypothetical protein
MLDIALKSNTTIPLGDNQYYFEIGNEDGQGRAPQYFILENAKVIRRPNKGTDKSKGTQANVTDLSKRDYNSTITRQRTQSKSGRYSQLETIQEYRQNMDRNFMGRASKAREYAERVKHHNIYNRNYRYNTHWQYIERILAQLVPQIASNIGARLIIGGGGLDNDELFSSPSTMILNRAGADVNIDTMTGELIGDFENVIG